MLSFDDPRWTGLLGGYRLPYDPRPVLRRLGAGEDAQGAWDELWENLHHQGDVDVAAYAALPHMARTEPADWNAYALCATIELARREERNPPIPSWLEADYRAGLRELAQRGARELEGAEDETLASGIIAVIALDRQLPALARLALLDEAEREEMLASAGWG